jgi:lipoyl(octanoyl) transferase
MRIPCVIPLYPSLLKHMVRAKYEHGSISTQVADVFSGATIDIMTDTPEHTYPHAAPNWCRNTVFEVLDCGVVTYAEGMSLQEKNRDEVLAAREGGGEIGRLLLLEHDPPVVTITKRPGAADHLIATEEQLALAGVEVCKTDRGGDITYHGPGQLVAYPILDLNMLGLNLHAYMRFLEEIVITVCSSFGVEVQRDTGATGVWVGDAKICALGVRVRRWVTTHGLALNVSTNLDHFGLIVPCGLAGRPVTSLSRELGDRCPTMPEVKHRLAEEFFAMTSKCSDKGNG